ncbi:MAG: hypothetical protein ACHQNA_04525 [Acidimicrobiales bacterium]
MFAVYCPRHDKRVLLFEDNIEALINHPGGIELHWRCTCGAAGVAEIGGAAEVLECERRAG